MPKGQYDRSEKLPSMTDGERRAYSRGYQRGARWPEHRPPMPPEPIVRALMEAAMALRDEADGICATIMEDDEFAVRLGPRIDAMDRSMAAISEWLKTLHPKGRE